MTEKSNMDYRFQWAGDSENPQSEFMRRTLPSINLNTGSYGGLSRCDVGLALTDR